MSIRNASHQGSWYDNPVQLVKSLEKYYDPKPIDTLKFIIAPHAGVCHSFYCNGLSSTAFLKWKNPINGPDLEVFQSQIFSPVDKKADAEEHSLEIMIPYLSLLMQKQERQLPILPIYCGTDPNESEINKIKGLVVDQKALIIISSDFCHYGPRFGYVPKKYGDTPDQAVDVVNMRTFEAIKVSAEKFITDIDDTGNTVCGRHSINAGLQIVGKYTAELFSYTKSSLLKNWNDSSVSYLGIVGK